MDAVMSGFELEDMRKATQDGGMSLTQQCRALAEIEKLKGALEDVERALRQSVRATQRLEREVRASVEPKFVGAAR
jgi:hypothetical protein